jgi:hypothetical protein
LTASEEGEVLDVEFVLDGVLHHVLDHRHPTRLAVDLLVASLPTRGDPNALSSLLK